MEMQIGAALEGMSLPYLPDEIFQDVAFLIVSIGTYIYVNIYLQLLYLAWVFGLFEPVRDVKVFCLE